MQVGNVSLVEVRDPATGDVMALQDVALKRGWYVGDRVKVQISPLDGTDHEVVAPGTKTQDPPPAPPGGNGVVYETYAIYDGQGNLTGYTTIIYTYSNGELVNVDSVTTTLR